MASLLIELLSEEIPAGMQRHAAQDLKRVVSKGLDSAGLKCSNLQVMVGPRRITLSADGFTIIQPDVTEERKGPRIDAPDSAIQGFLNSVGFSSADDAEIRDLPKGKFYFGTIERKGRSTADVLQEVIQSELENLSWPKSMRWGMARARWVRPLHQIVCLFDGDVVPITFAGISAGKETKGHRFLASDKIEVSSFDNYVERLEKAYVMVDSAKREDTIRKGLRELADKAGLCLVSDEPLIKEVAGLVEWPVLFLGEIDSEFMDVPPEVLISAMRKHQRYFAFENKDGSFADRFGVVANIEATDGGAAIVAGNERVLRARLADAQFFWDQDRMQTLESRVDKLDDRIFQSNLGTIGEKVNRMEILSSSLSRYLKDSKEADVRRAALICKSDLLTEMVGEFPDLQGVMGRYYALNDKEPESVADAVAEHYAPQGPSDVCPSAPVSVCISLADKIDTLVGFFSINQKPTGSRDPFALRRAALGVVRLIIENGLRIPLGETFRKAHAIYGRKLTSPVDVVADELLVFFADRLKVYLRDKGVRHDLISAVFAIGSEDDLTRLIARVNALSAFLETDDGANLLVAYRRAANIVRIEEKRDTTQYPGDVIQVDLLQEDAHRLYTALLATEKESKSALEKDDFGAAMSVLAKLCHPVNVFFENVTVNVDNVDLRILHLNLLSRIGKAVSQVADFSMIEG